MAQHFNKTRNQHLNFSSLTDYFERQIEDKKIDPSSTAIQFKGERLSFQDLHRKSDILAKVLYLELQGIQNRNPDGDKIIAVCMNPSIELVITLFAIWKAGAAYVPTEAIFPNNRILHITNDCFPMLMLVTDENNETRFNQMNLPCKVLNYVNCVDEISPVQIDEVEQQSVAIVMYTSGSSGIPKGVRVTHRGILNRLFWQWENFPFRPKEKCCMKTTFTFGDSVAEIFGPLLQGVPLSIIPQNIVAQADLFVQTLEDLEITRIVLVPTLLRNILDVRQLLGKGSLLENIKLWICSGEALNLELIRRFFEAFPVNATLCNFYGSTEVTFDVTYETFESLADVEKKIDQDGNVPIGKPIWNAEVHVLDDNLKELPNGSVGNLFVSGILLAEGYVGDNLADKFMNMKIRDQSSSDIVFRTGDLATYRKSKDAHLNLYFDGRNDSQVKVRGNRVELKEIELVLSKMQGIREAIVLCCRQNTEHQTIVAFTMTKSTVCEIKEYLNDKLQQYQMPIIFKIEDKPLLVNGKTDRQKLLRLYEESLKEQCDEINWDLVNIPNCDPIIADQILRAISEVTNVSPAFILNNLNHSFYAIGGNSQNTIKAILKLKEFGVCIDVQDFVRANSISEIIQFANENRPTIKLKTNDDYFCEPLTQDHREAVIKMVSYADAYKADIFVLLQVSEEEVSEWFESVFDFYVDGGLSFVVKRKSDGMIVGSAINKPFTDATSLATNFKPSKAFAYYFEFLKTVDQSQKDKVFKLANNILRSGGVETHASLSPGENVFMVQFIEGMNIELAKLNGFDAIISTNNNACTQQIVRDVWKYDVIMDRPLKDFEAADGCKPFIKAKDTQRSLCCFKIL